jgi:dolichol-phosphate mannosyltransferase
MSGLRSRSRILKGLSATSEQRFDSNVYPDLFRLYNLNMQSLVSESTVPFKIGVERSSSMHERAQHRRPVFARKLALAIPTLCEADNIPELLGCVRAVLDALNVDYEILIVDDDSCDGTADVVSALAREDERIRLLVRKGQRGLSGAILHGWENTDATIVGVMDADFQHPPELLAEFAKAIASGCDLVIGSRYALGGGFGRWNVIRRFLSASGVWATWPLQRVGLRVKDPLSGFFFVRRECLSGIEFQQSGFKLLLEILVRARISSVREIPFAFGQRHRGSSKANIEVALEYGRLLARLYCERLGLGRSVPVSTFD